MTAPQRPAGSAREAAHVADERRERDADATAIDATAFDTTAADAPGDDREAAADASGSREVAERREADRERKEADRERKDADRERKDADRDRRADRGGERAAPRDARDRSDDERRRDRRARTDERNDRSRDRDDDDRRDDGRERAASSDSDDDAEEERRARDRARSRLAATSERAGHLTVDAVPYATIYIDGKRVGDTPLVRLELPVGRHRVKAVSSTGKARSFTVEVTPGAKLRRRIRFDR